MRTTTVALTCHRLTFLLRRYEQTWPAGAARFPPYIALKVVVNAVLLNYSAAAFQVGTQRCNDRGLGVVG